MATLKDHQKAMVDLLANGSAIPASAARLAHALHDVLGLLLERDSEPHSSSGVECGDATPPRAFINDVRLAADLAMGPRHRDAQNIDNLRAELANVTTQRDTYKARCESLEAQAFDLCEQIEELKLRLLGAPVTYCGFPKIVDLTECSEVAVIPLRYIDHIIARIGGMTGVEQGDIAKVVSAIAAISPKP